MSLTEKLLGCCTLCQKEVYEILAYFPSEHPLAGEPRRIGKALPNARRALLRLLDGKTCAITVCEECKVTPAVLPKLWDICMRANAQQLDPEYRKAAGMREISEERREACLRSLRTEVVNPPLLVEAVIRVGKSDGSS